MKKFTFISEYRGGTYISQYIAEDLIIALNLWANNLDKKIYSISHRQRIKIEMSRTSFSFEAIENIDNVWCTCFLSSQSFLLLNIIETV